MIAHAVWQWVQLTVGMYVMALVYRMHRRIDRLEDPPVDVPRPTDQLDSRVRDSELFRMRDADGSPVVRAIARELLDRRMVMSQIVVCSTLGQVRQVMAEARITRRTK